MKECKELLLWICRMLLGDGLIIDMTPDRILHTPVAKGAVEKISIEEARQRCGTVLEPPIATHGFSAKVAQRHRAPAQRCVFADDQDDGSHRQLSCALGCQWNTMVPRVILYR